MKRKILMTLMLCLVSVVALTTAGYAWFTMTTDVTVDQLTIGVEANSNLTVAMWDKTASAWGAYKDEDQHLTSFNPSADVTNISGDGLTFFEKVSQTASESTFATLNSTAAAAQYVEVKLSFRTSEAQEIYLGNGSACVPQAATKSGASAVNPTSYADSDANLFTKDYICAATRFAFINQTTPAAVEFIWAPNETFQLSKNGYYYTFNESGTEQTEYKYIKSLNATGYSATNPELGDMADVYDDVQIAAVNGTTHATGLIGTTEQGKNGHTDDFYYLDVTIRVWIEGTDREAENALAGGKFLTTMKFYSVNVVPQP